MVICVITNYLNTYSINVCVSFRFELTVFTMFIEHTCTCPNGAQSTSGNSETIPNLCQNPVADCKSCNDGYHISAAPATGAQTCAGHCVYIDDTVLSR